MNNFWIIARYWQNKLQKSPVICGKKNWTERNGGNITVTINITDVVDDEIRKFLTIIFV